ncbi:MAG: SET domain-containing protein-lysine N-methyltransferase [Casimicrobiaceae bacterium]
MARGVRIDRIRGRPSSRATRLTIQYALNRHVVPARPWCFLNHECDPSCDVQVEGGILYLVARRDLRSGAELTFDYATTERCIAARSPCRCGALQCRGRLAGYTELTLSERQQLGQRPLRYLLRLCPDRAAP